MNNINILLLSLLTLSIIGITSCKKDNTDIRDQYVGTWQYTTIGNLTFYQNGQSIGTAPINNKGAMNISKSGDDVLIINGTSYTVNGNKISSGSYPINENDNGVSIVGTGIDNGQLGSNIITINSSITGTWNNSNGASGNLSGSATYTLAK